MEIIDNFLTEEEHEIIKSTMLENQFPWFVADTVKAEDSKELAHLFYGNYMINSNYWSVVQPIINKVDPYAIVRIRAALYPKRRQNPDTGWHCDVPYHCTTAIYYVNSNNGYTLFEDGTKVESIGNRFVFFDSQQKHTAVWQTDTDFRCLINFNYF